jgi:hypothetical protein
MCGMALEVPIDKLQRLAIASHQGQNHVLGYHALRMPKTGELCNPCAQLITVSKTQPMLMFRMGYEV